MNVISLQVWCYECDEYVEGWDVIEQIRGEFDGMLDIEGTENSFTNHSLGVLKSRGSGTGTNSYHTLLFYHIY